jgi:hypothetical protein
MHGECHHLQLGIGAAHAVAIDQRQTAGGRDHERRRRVHAACLAAEHRVDLAAEQLLELSEGGHQLVALWQFLGHHGRRAHHADGHDQRVVGEFLDIDDLHRAMLTDRLLGHQLADIGIAATAGAEDRAADGNVFEVFGIDCAQDLHDNPRQRGLKVRSG